MYECVICYSLNNNKRHHCQNCGTIPAFYSILNRPARLIEHEGLSQFIAVDRCAGAQSIERWHFTRVMLRTVELDYYASE